MKRNLYDSIGVIQGANGAAVDRDGCLSAVFVADISEIAGSPTASAMEVAVSHCDTSSGDFEAVPDTCLFVGCAGKQDIAAGQQAIWQIDLIACKRYIKVTATPAFTGGTSPTATATYALVLGDKRRNP